MQDAGPPAPPPAAAVPAKPPPGPPLPLPVPPPADAPGFPCPPMAPLHPAASSPKIASRFQRCPIGASRGNENHFRITPSYGLTTAPLPSGLVASYRWLLDQVVHPGPDDTTEGPHPVGRKRLL